MLKNTIDTMELILNCTYSLVRCSRVEKILVLVSKEYGGSKVV